MLDLNQHVPLSPTTISGHLGSLSQHLMSSVGSADLLSMTVASMVRRCEKDDDLKSSRMKDYSGVHEDVKDTSLLLKRKRIDDVVGRLSSHSTTTKTAPPPVSFDRCSYISTRTHRVQTHTCFCIDPSPR